MLVWLLALSCCGECCTGDQYIPWDAVSHLPCCHVHDQFNILAVLLLLAWGLSLEAVAVGDMGWWWAPVFGSHALVGCPTLFFLPAEEPWVPSPTVHFLVCLNFFSPKITHSLLLSPPSPQPRQNRKLEHYSVPLYLDVKYCVRSTTFTNNVLELEECEQSDPFFLFQEIVLSKERLKLEGK